MDKAKYIKNFRNKYSYTVKELAEELCVSISIIYQWERGDKIPRDCIIKLIKTLDEENKINKRL